MVRDVAYRLLHHLSECRDATVSVSSGGWLTMTSRVFDVLGYPHTKRGCDAPLTLFLQQPPHLPIGPV